MAVLAQPARQFAGGGRLTGTLQSDDHEHAGRIVGEAEFGFVAAQDFDQLIAHDGDDLLRRRERLQYFLTHRFNFDVFD